MSNQLKQPQNDPDHSDQGQPEGLNLVPLSKCKPMDYNINSSQLHDEVDQHNLSFQFQEFIAIKPFNDSNEHSPVHGMPGFNSPEKKSLTLQQHSTPPSNQNNEDPTSEGYDSFNAGPMNRRPLTRTTRNPKGLKAIIDEALHEEGGRTSLELLDVPHLFKVFQQQQQVQTNEDGTNNNNNIGDDENQLKLRPLRTVTTTHTRNSIGSDEEYVPSTHHQSFFSPTTGNSTLSSTDYDGSVISISRISGLLSSSSSDSDSDEDGNHIKIPNNNNSDGDYSPGGSSLHNHRSNQLTAPRTSRTTNKFRGNGGVYIQKLTIPIDETSPLPKSALDDEHEHADHSSDGEDPRTRPKPLTSKTIATSSPLQPQPPIRSPSTPQIISTTPPLSTIPPPPTKPKGTLSSPTSPLSPTKTLAPSPSSTISPVLLNSPSNTMISPHVEALSPTNGNPPAMIRAQSRNANASNLQRSVIFPVPPLSESESEQQIPIKSALIDKKATQYQQRRRINQLRTVTFVKESSLDHLELRIRLYQPQKEENLPIITNPQKRPKRGKKGFFASVKSLFSGNKNGQEPQTPTNSSSGESNQHVFSPTSPTTIQSPTTSGITSPNGVPSGSTPTITGLSVNVNTKDEQPQRRSSISINGERRGSFTTPPSPSLSATKSPKHDFEDQLSEDDTSDSDFDNNEPDCLKNTRANSLPKGTDIDNVLLSWEMYYSGFQSFEPRDSTQFVSFQQK